MRNVIILIILFAIVLAIADTSEAKSTFEDTEEQHRVEYLLNNIGTKVMPTNPTFGLGIAIVGCWFVLRYIDKIDTRR